MDIETMISELTKNYDLKTCVLAETVEEVAFDGTKEYTIVTTYFDTNIGEIAYGHDGVITLLESRETEAVIMENIRITQTTSNYAKRGNKWVEMASYKTIVDENTYDNVVNSKSFFANLGAHERYTKSYTCKGYIVTRINSISPNRQNKTVYNFEFTNIKEVL
jgi:hypothetical protein